MSVQPTRFLVANKGIARGRHYVRQEGDVAVNPSIAVNPTVAVNPSVIVNTPMGEDEDGYDDVEEGYDDVEEGDLEEDGGIDGTVVNECTPERARRGDCDPTTGVFFGVLPAKEDEITQIRLDALLASSAIPQRAVDWSTIPNLDVGPVRNQGSTTSCWAHAFAAIWYHEMKKKDPIPNLPFPSILWLVANAGGSSCGGGGGGASYAYGFVIANELGMLPEGAFPGDKPSNLPLNSNDCLTANSRITSKHRALAQRYATNLAGAKRMGIIFGLTCGRGREIPRNPDSKAVFVSSAYTKGTSCIGGETKAEAIYKMLAQGYPVLVFMQVGGEFMNFNGGATPVRSVQPYKFSHAVVFCGFDNIKVGSTVVPCFRVKNSWYQQINQFTGGKIVTTYKPWKDNGFCWLSTETASAWSDAASYRDTAFVSAPPVFRLTDDPTTLPPATGKPIMTIPNLPTPTIIQPTPTVTVTVQPPRPQLPTTTVIQPPRPQITTTQPQVTTTTSATCAACTVACQKQFTNYTADQCSASRLCSGVCSARTVFKRRVR